MLSKEWVWVGEPWYSPEICMRFITFPTLPMKNLFNYNSIPIAWQPVGHTFLEELEGGKRKRGQREEEQELEG